MSRGQARALQAGGAARAPARFVVAFSGGLDSTVLLHLAVAFFGADAVLAVHVNHHLQPAASLFEAQARKTCRAWGVGLKVCHLKGAPAKGESTEAWARQQRYVALGRVAREQGIAIVMTAHHQDDQVESLLIALSRGAGLEGLRGIAEARPLAPEISSVGPSRRPAAEGVSDVQVHRPLLACSREEIEAHAQTCGLHWAEDPSNQDRQFLRNRIRAEVLPVLRQALPGFARQATRSMTHIANAASQGEQALTSAATSLAIPRLRQLEPAAQGQMLRSWLRANGLPAPSQARLKAVLGQLLGEHPSQSIALGEARLRRERQRCWIEKPAADGLDRRPAAANAQAAPDGPAPQQVRGEFRCDASGVLQASTRGWIWHLPAFKGLLVIEPGVAAFQDRQTELAALQALTIRAAKSSLKMQIDAARPRRTLKNLFQEAAIPAALRERLPCVQRGEEVLFVAGLGNAPNSPWTFRFLPDL